MKLLNITVRNIVGLVVIIALAAAMIQLVRGQTRSPQTAQAGPTTANTPIVTATPLPTNPPDVLPTATLWPTSNTTPLTTDPYPIFQVTPIPGPTYTPTPESPKLRTANSNPTEQTLASFDSFISNLTWSRDGKYLAFTTEAGAVHLSTGTVFQYNLWILPMQSGSSPVLLDEQGTYPSWSPDSQWLLYTSEFEQNKAYVKAIKPDGSEQKILSTGRAWPAFWKTNEQIYFFGDNNLFATSIVDEVAAVAVPSSLSVESLHPSFRYNSVSGYLFSKNPMESRLNVYDLSGQLVMSVEV